MALRDGLGVLADAVADRLVADEHGVAVDADGVALADLLEHALAEVVDERDAGLDQHLADRGSGSGRRSTAWR